MKTPIILVCSFILALILIAGVPEYVKLKALQKEIAKNEAQVGLKSDLFPTYDDESRTLHIAVTQNMTGVTRVKKESILREAIFRHHLPVLSIEFIGAPVMIDGEACYPAVLAILRN